MSKTGDYGSTLYDVGDRVKVTLVRSMPLLPQHLSSPTEELGEGTVTGVRRAGYGARNYRVTLPTGMTLDTASSRNLLLREVTV